MSATVTYKLIGCANIAGTGNIDSDVASFVYNLQAGAGYVSGTPTSTVPLGTELKAV